MKTMNYTRILHIILFVIILTGCQPLSERRPEPEKNAPRPFSLTILHVNDTHSHLEETRTSLLLNGQKTYLDLGGFARLASKVMEERNSTPALLLLHGGDALQGTLYFTKYLGEPEVGFMNQIGFDAMVTGNHEYDKGPGLLARFIGRAEFPVLAANIDTRDEPLLKDKIPPFFIKEIGGERVGIIGLVSPDTPKTSSPGPNIIFKDPEQVARQTVKELEAQGVNKIIALTHIGNDRDMELAAHVEGIDVVVGGHTHTLLGDVQGIGLHAEGPYPVLATSPEGNKTCIVQAWSLTRLLGELQVQFDRQGHVLQCEGHPILLAGRKFSRKNAAGKMVGLNRQEQQTILRFISEQPMIEVVDEAPESLAFLAPYQKGIEAMRNEVVGRVAEDLLHVRIPGSRHPASGEIMYSGSQLAPVVAESMLWKTRKTGTADLALIQGGGVRTDLEAGVLTVGQVLELLPFGNTLVVLELSGGQIKEMLEETVDIATDPAREGAFPYFAGARYRVDMSQNKGKRISGLELRLDDGAWNPMSDDTLYRLVTPSYLAGGGDGYTLLAKPSTSRYDTGFTDAEVFMEYVKAAGPLRRLETNTLEYIGKPSGH